MIDQLLGWLALYGIPALFGILVLTSAGFPFPDSLLMLAVGSFVEQGELKLWQVLVFGSAGAILGDQTGYCIGRFGGKRLVKRITDRFGGADKIKKSHEFMEKWGGAGVFFSRWLVGPLGPWINISAGVTEYPWKHFIIWDILGEVLWVSLYVTLGMIFSDRVERISELLGDVTWVILGTLVAVFLGWKLLRYFRGS